MTRVFILAQHPLFGSAIASLLNRQPEIEIIGQETDLQQALSRIGELRPDVVIVDHQDRQEPSTAVLRILGEAGAERIVELNLNDNTLRLYHDERRVVKCVADFVQAITTCKHIDKLKQ